MSGKKWLITVFTALLIIMGAAAYLLFKIGQKSLYVAKWSDYDDCGWA